MAELNRQKRQVLRQIQDHFNLTNKRRGVQFEQASTIDIYHHPQDTAAHCNYVTPRRGAAWVPGTDMQSGLNRLAALRRVPRIEMVKGLFPTAFHMQVRKLGLAVESDLPILTYGVLPDCEQQAEDLPALPAATRQLAAFGVAEEHAVGLFLRLGPEGHLPDLQVARKVWENVVAGQEMIFLVSHDYTLAGGANVVLNPPVAQIVCADTIAPFRHRGVASLAIRLSVQYAQAQGCTLVYMVAPCDESARLYRRLGFVDLDSMITYCRPSEAGEESEENIEGDNVPVRNLA